MSCRRSRTLAFIAGAMMTAMPFVGLYTAASAEFDEGNIVTVNIPLSAKSGALLDRKGRPLSYDSESKTICLLPQLFYSDEVVDNALFCLIESDESIAESFSLPVSAEGGQTGSDDEIKLMQTVTGLDGAKPSELLDRLYDVFRIDKKAENAYAVLCIRYAALLCSDDMLVLCDSPSEKLSEQAQMISQSEPFVTVSSRFIRKYKKTSGQAAAPHIVTEYEQQHGSQGSDGYQKTSYRLYNGGIAKREQSGIDAQDGQDIRLTIDRDMQLKAQSLIKDMISQGRCTAGSVCVVSCKTGGVLSAASAPDFDPGRLAEDYDALSEDAAAPLFDRALMGLYRPGSAMKTITAIAALDAKAIDKDTYLWCGKWYPLGDTMFSCLGYHGYESVQTALRDSCNVYFYKASQMIGVDRLSAMQQAFGLGKSIDIPLENARGRVVTPGSVAELGIAWSEGLLLQSAIGQSETAVTPLQMAQWAQIIANDGCLKPLTLTDGDTKDKKRILKNDYAFAQVKEGMIMAADNIWGEASLSALPYKAAIKTGTPETGSGYNSTVIGFYPADKPEIAFSIVLENSECSYELVRPLLEEWESLR